MFNKATDAVSKMTIKMNESDIVSASTPLHCPALALQLPALLSSWKAPQPCGLWESALES